MLKICLDRAIWPLWMSTPAGGIEYRALEDDCCWTNSALVDVSGRPLASVRDTGHSISLLEHEDWSPCQLVL